MPKWIKYIAIVMLFFILALVQASFLPQIAIMGTVPNLVFILFFLLLFFQKENAYYQTLFIAVLAGFFSSLFSPFNFGFVIVSMIIVSGATKLMMYFLHQQQDERRVWHFMPMFLVCFLLYQACFFIMSHLPYAKLSFSTPNLAQIGYSMLVACLAFYLYPVKRPVQLKLL